MEPRSDLPESGLAAKASLTASEYILLQIGRLESQGEWLVREVQALREDVKAIRQQLTFVKDQLTFVKGAAWAIGILVPLAVTLATWFLSSRFEAAVQAIRAAAK
jgi:hypothetical protein